MLFLHGAVVVMGSILWLLMLFPLILIETVRYGLEVIVGIADELWERWLAWVDGRRAL